MQCEDYHRLRVRDAAGLDAHEGEFVHDHIVSCTECRAVVEAEAVRIRARPPAGWPCLCMAQHLALPCTDHRDPMECPDALVVYFEVTGASYGLPVRDGPDACATSMVEILHCPWCGTRLHAYRRPGPDSET